ncbi:MAG TPA: hypothetical protein VHI54_00815 [Actinomycetota bacterium]|nr:hypothetical protein [Actinomycetota bacterium]
MEEAVSGGETFWKGIAITVSAIIIFIGSVYILLAAYMGRLMGYLVLAVSLFGWMIILSALWAFGAPGTPKNLGPRGTEPHWQVFAAGTGAISSRFEETGAFPNRPWKPADASTQSSADTVRTAIQTYMAQRANEELHREGSRVELEPQDFTVKEIGFTQAEDGTYLAAGRAFYSLGGPEVTVFTYHDTGNVNAQSWGFLGASVFGFLVHLPFLDRAEKKRRAILTGGAAPPWYGPA